ncbi:MAG: diadenylate cyclase [Deltaproteobacteria bacterium]|nr:diadenylate cyclase [Deltaproteobacteria bacterium]
MSKVHFIINELLSWRAALDILLISAGLFFLHRTLVRLGTWKILVGIAAAFLIFGLASMLNLEGIEWIFQNVSQVAVLALIVIFQPELRKILEKIVSLYGSRHTSADQSLTQIVADSLWQLGQKKQGALIVYPGREPVEEKLSGGYPLTAEASVPLIMSIFDPNSPGHDGAMIIENNKLCRFGVRLPISQTSRLAEQYGTRHHAAMGLAEVTDALVLVVSEERGMVSAFINGKMTRFDSPQQIIAEILQHQTRHGTLTIGNLNLIDRRTSFQVAGSLLIAVIFWTVLASSNKEVVERLITLPIDYSVPADDLLLVGERIEEARVRVAGPRSAVNDFILTQPSLKIDLSQVVEGTQTSLITADRIGTDKISFLEITPAQVEITLAKYVKRLVPINPQLLGNLPPNRKLKSVSVVPAEIRVLAPSLKEGEKLLSISTTPVYLNSIQSTSRIFCKIIAPPDIQPAIKPWQDVEVIIEVETISKKEQE